MKKIFWGLLLSGMILSACGTTKVIESNVTKTGILMQKVGSEYLLKTNDGIVNITSKKIDFEKYLKKEIKVTGQFSGSTLYVDNIQSP